MTLPSTEPEIITEESSFNEEISSNSDPNSINIIYDLIKKPHWTNKYNLIQEESSNHIDSFSSNPSSLSLNSNNENQTDDEDEYDQEKGRQLIQRLIEETLAIRLNKFFKK